MGWLEIIPLLRKLYPLLSSAVPMLESTLAGRSAGRAEAAEALQKASTAASTQLAELGRTNAVVLRTLNDHSDRLLVIADDLKQLRQADELYGRRLEAMEEQVQRHGAFQRLTSLFALVLLLVCVALLAIPYFHHAQ